MAVTMAFKLLQMHGKQPEQFLFGEGDTPLQRMLRHASAGMTVDTYADLFDDDLDDVAQALSRARSVAGVRVQEVDDLSVTRPREPPATTPPGLDPGGQRSCSNLSHEAFLAKAEAPRSQCFQGFAGLLSWR